ncbi:hypothetical protein BCD64_22255 [Nostoc sp. MBR 210]|nr:hypothetical protein BCD64_22255 [Nostoc sp. MBR 210]
MIDCADFRFEIADFRFFWFICRRCWAESIQNPPFKIFNFCTPTFRVNPKSLASGHHPQLVKLLCVTPKFNIPIFIEQVDGLGGQGK